MDALMILQTAAGTVQHRFVFFDDSMAGFDRTHRDCGGAWQGSLLPAICHIGSGMVVDLLIEQEIYLYEVECIESMADLCAICIGYKEL